MLNTTQKQIDIHPLITNRWSPRAFADKPVSKEKLDQLFEAARQAPSSFNEQPWRFIVAAKDDPETYETLYNCLKEGNKKWADTAPVLVLSIAKTRFTRNDKPNRHAFHDVGLAMGNLLMQATALNLHVHQMAGFYVEKAEEMFNIPDGYEPVAIAAIGYRGDPEILPDVLADKESPDSDRKPLDEIVISSAWKNKTEFTQS